MLHPKTSVARRWEVQVSIQIMPSSEETAPAKWSSPLAGCRSFQTGRMVEGLALKGIPS